MGYKVKLNVFEGPFDLLVYLIENAQMNIYDIEIAEITRQYLSYVDEMKQMEVPIAAEFMVLAASLIEIKSKMLLPKTAPEQNEKEMEDPRSELVEKLLEYKRFKFLAEMLQQQEERSLRIIEKPQEDLSQYMDAPDEYLTLDLYQFVTAFDLFLRKKKKMEEIQTHHMRTEKQKITAEARIADIRSFFTSRAERPADFMELVADRKDRYDIALTFSSVLELIKEKRLIAEQSYIYGNITVRATKELMEEREID